MNAKLIMLAVTVALIGAGALMMCDDSDAAAGDVLASGSAGTSATYEIRSLNADDSQVELIISGTGQMTNWNQSSAVPWQPYLAQITKITLSDEITRLGNYAFQGCTALASIAIPDAVTAIGNYAFQGCTALVSVDLPETIDNLDTGVFAYCTSLTSIKLPTGMNHLGHNTTTAAGTFQGCTALESVSIIDVSYYIGNNVFNGCRSLTSIEIGDSARYIYGSAFNGCTSLTSIEIGTSLVSIDSTAFTNCTALTTATMPAIAPTKTTGLNNLTTLRYTTTVDWTSTNYTYTPQYLSRATLQSITFANDHIPAFALYGQNLDTLTITNASGPDYLGIYTAPNVKATASALTVDGTAADIVRLTDVRGAAELLDGGINLNDVDVHWDTSPHGYATGEVDASPEVLVYPAGIHTSTPNQYAGLINAIPLIVIVAIITTIIGMIAIRRD